MLLEILEGMGLPRLYYSSAGVRDGIIADPADQRAVQAAGLHPPAPGSFLKSELVVYARVRY